MDLMEQIAEQRLQEAEARGELRGLAGEGAPLPLDEDPMMPEELRMAYRVLRNANCLPPELAQRQEIRRLEELLAHVDDAHTGARDEARRRLTALRVSVEARRGGTAPLWADPAYQERLARRMDPAKE
ncbi:DnaJ family domain-containing protein [Arhodomonas sp. SL1]|uniref:DnaJ family domain-containing protein n=1 Tax=Arhodomonas sp. SL1 TaxID=3425691 RepID=UPI003F880D54